MTESAFVEDLLRGMEPGDARLFLTGPPDAQPAFLVRERSAVIRYLGDTSVELRGGLFPIGQVVLTAAVFRAGRHYRKEYALLLDYHQPGVAEIFSAMSKREYLSFYFHGDAGRREKTVIASNQLGPFFSRAVERILLLPAWSGERFRAAAEKLQARFPTPAALWEALVPPGEQ